MNKSLINKYCRKFGFEIHGAGYMQSIRKQSFKDDAFEIQQQILNEIKHPLIFDVGANRGDVTAKYLSANPNSTIHAFEPFSQTFSILNERYKNLDNVICHEFAISNINSRLKFYINHNVDTNSLLKPAFSGLSSDSQVKNESTTFVECTTIDDFCNGNGINHIDILKMDIQGGELDALKGAKQLLTKKEVKLIFLEVYFIEQYESHPLFHDISKFLFENGYSLQDLYYPIYGNNNLAWADAIFKIR